MSIDLARLVRWSVGLLLSVMLALPASASAMVSPRPWRALGQIVTTGRIAGLSCPSASLCVAVGDGGRVLVSERPAAGKRNWRATDVDGDNPIAAISCPSTSLCVAVDGVGNVLSSTDPAGGASAWSVEHVDNGTPQTDAYSGDRNLLTAISCPLVSFCVAVDGVGRVLVSSDPAGGPGAWSSSQIDHTAYYECVHYGTYPCPSPPLISISCPSQSFCLAADDNGSAFSTHDPAAGASAWQTRDIAPFSELDGFSCWSDSQCVGICPVGFDAGGCQGDRYASGAIVIWNPGSGQPRFATISSTQLYGIWCPSVSLCFTSTANGDVIDSMSPANARTWAAAYANRPSRTALRPLAGVVCPRGSPCIAINIDGDLLVGGRPPSADQLKALLGAASVPSPARRELGSVLEHGGSRRSFDAPSAGRLSIVWTAGTGHRPSSKRRRVVAKAAVPFTTSRIQTVAVKLTHFGRQLPARSERVTLTATATFTAKGDLPITVSRRFTLRRGNRAVRTEPSFSG